MENQHSSGTEAAAQNRRRNSLDYVRLFLAILVIVSHAPENMDGNRTREPLTMLFGTRSSGELAVNGFFVLSGFLIALSWQRDPRLWAFLGKRVRRIYPGFLAAALVTGLVFAPFGTDAAAYFHAFHLKAFLLGLPLLQQFVPESFQGLPYAAVNSGLWTISYEFLCYFLVAGLGAFGLLRRKAALWFPLAAFVLMTFHLAYSLEWFVVPDNFRFPAQLLRLDQLCRFLAYYIAGVSYAFFGTGTKLSARTLGILLVLLLAGMFSKVTADFALMTCGTILLLRVGLRTYPLLERLPLRADISYGTYLYGWTIEQIVIQRLPGASPLIIALVTIPPSLIAGWLSWHLVEKRFLDKRR